MRLHAPRRCVVGAKAFFRELTQLADESRDDEHETWVKQQPPSKDEIKEVARGPQGRSPHRGRAGPYPAAEGQEDDKVAYPPYGGQGFPCFDCVQRQCRTP